MRASKTNPVLQKPPGFRNDQTAPSRRRRPILPPTFQPQNKTNNRRSRLLCFFLCFIFIITIAGGSFIYLWFQPHLPVFHLQSIKFLHFNLTTGEEDGPSLTTQAIVLIETRNPNSVLNLSYKKMTVYLKTGNTDLGCVGSVSGFSQGKKNTTVLKFKTDSKNVLVTSVEMGKLSEDFRAKKLVVGIEVETWIGFATEGWNLIPIEIKVSCGDGFRLKQIENGVVPRCYMSLLKWYVF